MEACFGQQIDNLIKKGPRKSIMDRYQSDVPRFNGAPHYASAAPYHTEHPPYESRHGFRDPDPRSTHAYLVGGGIASLAAAASLIHDANIPAAQVHILESSTLTGGSMDGAGSPETGYILRGGRMLNFSYRCLYELLSTIPSLTDPKITVMDEINMFNAVQGNRTHANARIVKGPGEYSDARPRLADASDFGLSVTDRMNLLEMTEKSEKRLGRLKIEECFSDAFFHTNFWIMWATM
jgi:oleate hydratase